MRTEDIGTKLQVVALGGHLFDRRRHDTAGKGIAAKQHSSLRNTCMD